MTMDISDKEFDRMCDTLYPDEEVVEKKEVKQRINYCTDCDLDMETVDYGYYACLNCGQCASTNVFVTDKKYEMNATLYSKKSIYKRRLYCREKLKLMCCRKKCFDEGYSKLIERLKKKKNINNVVQLKQCLKDWNKRRYYKHIYNIFNDIKGIKLICLTPIEIHRLSAQFVNLEIKFKRITKRKNIFNYSSIIFQLMKKNHIKGYKNIILPLNHLQISKQIKRYVV